MLIQRVDAAIGEFERGAIAREHRRRIGRKRHAEPLGSRDQLFGRRRRVARHPPSPISASSTRSGVMGNRYTRLPMALAIALAIEAAAPIKPGSPTPLAPNGSARLGMLDDDGIDLERRIECGRHLVVHERRIGEPAAFIPLHFLGESVAHALHEAALDLAFDHARIDSSPDVVRGPDAQHAHHAR